MDIKELSNPFRDESQSRGDKANYGKLYEFLSLKFNKAMYQLTQNFQEEQNLRRLLRYQRLKNDSITDLIGMIDNEKGEVEVDHPVFEKLQKIVESNPDLTDVIEGIFRLESGDDVEVDRPLNDFLFFQEISLGADDISSSKQVKRDDGETDDGEDESADVKRLKQLEKPESLPLNKVCWLKEHHPNIFSS